MRSPIRFSRIFFVSVLGVFAFLSLGRLAFPSLIDWAKHEEWRRKQMQKVLDDVQANGSAKYVVLSFRNYDTNKDGTIDAKESTAIAAELKQLAEADAKKKQG